MLTPINRLCFWFILIAGLVMVGDSLVWFIQTRELAYLRIVIGFLAFTYALLSFSAGIRRTVVLLAGMDEAKDFDARVLRKLARREVYFGRQAFRKELHRQMQSLVTKTEEQRVSKGNE